jgi:hypothetical protein
MTSDVRDMRSEIQEWGAALRAALAGQPWAEPLLRGDPWRPTDPAQTEEPRT